MHKFLQLFLLFIAAVPVVAQDSIVITEFRSDYTNKVIAKIDGKTSKDSAQIAKCITSAEQIPKDYRFNVGPDASYVEIDITLGKKKMKLSSWHPFYEANGKVVATSNGLEALNGRNLNDVIKEQPKEYQLFRVTFDQICAEAKNAAEQGAATNSR
jgi:hypothetical protein